MKTTEDFAEDVIIKAQRGLGLTNRELCSQANLSLDTLKSIKKGIVNKEALVKIAAVLKLNEKGLLSLSDGWMPEVPKVNGLAQITTYYFEMNVNAYIVSNLTSMEAFVFDTGVDAQPLIEYIHDNSLTPKGLYITHAHPDHVAGVQDLSNSFPGMPIWLPDKEAFSGIKPFESLNHSFEDIKIESRSTFGHSPGGTTYLVKGLESSLSVVGDALFAGSQGGVAADFYHIALQKNHEEIFSLNEETVICPGHGPMTTVAQEKIYNCFFSSDYL